MSGPDDARSDLRRMFRNPAVVNGATLRGLVAAMAIAAVVIGPADRAFTAVVVAVTLGVVGSIDVVTATPGTGRNQRLRGAAAVAVGVLLLAWPAPTAVVLGRMVGLVLVGLGVAMVAKAVAATRRQEPWSLHLAGAVVATLAGVLVVAWPIPGLEVGLVAIAVGWIAAAGIALGYGVPRVRNHEPLEVAPSETLRIVGLWLAGRQLEPVALEELHAKLFFDGADQRDRRSRFAVLLALSVLIATFGVLADSTAVVIGAMLVAPLMTPIMATTLALVSGWPKRAAVAAITVLAGVVGAVVLAAVASRFAPTYVDVAVNNQIASRVAPTYLDLLIAVAAGAAGAFALTRRDVADSLPGVAVAVALVPPLAVVGLSLEAGAMSDAWGALLLFTTNLVAIILSGGVVFVLMGTTPWRQLTRNRRRLATYALTVFAALVIVSIPLVATGTNVARQALVLAEARTVVDQWLADRPGAQIIELRVTDTVIRLVVAGEGDPPPGEPLVASMADALGRPATVDLRWIPEIRQVLE